MSLTVDVKELPSLNKVSDLNLNEKVWGVEYNKGLVWQMVTTYQACARSGNKANLSRSDVRGGGIKPWRQKGLGRARAGTNTSPIWRTGGVTFAAKPRSFAKIMPKKMFRNAVKSLLSELLRNGVIEIVGDIKVDNHKTKTAINLLGNLLNKPVILLVAETSKELELSVRNLPKVKLISVKSFNPVLLAGAEKIIATQSAISFCEEWLS